ncbi:serine hydrolase domain-containing protein [Sphingomonas bacterium]|uniref:serine hydrolase domain-containing protein n=1 Tax=Sphingomonas bacterium TaxID=1895847 RepID=UPI0020C66742|nr:serine hydrolase domain-containing protein [Sphingomonas bacterium]
MALAGAVPANGQSLSPDQISTIDQAAAKALADTGVPAASIAIVRDGAIVYTKAYGFQRAGEPARTDARYSIASVGKQLTAAAVLILVDEGKLSLDDKVAKYLPDLTRANDVTIRQLLSHTSGYRDYWPQDYLFDDMTRPTTPTTTLDRWAKAPLDFEPGTQWQYSNTGYVVAGRIVELVSGQSLATFLKDHVFTRTGMHPVASDSELTRADPAGYGRDGLGPVHAIDQHGTGWGFAAGQFAMTAADLARWDISVIKQSVMSRAAYAAQQHEVVLANGVGTGYGLGVFVSEVNGHRLIQHNGGDEGFYTENRIFPDDGTAIVVAINGDFGNAHFTIADAIQGLLFADSSGVARARALYAMISGGRLDRAQLTANGAYYLSPLKLAEYRAGLAPLGNPKTVVQTQSGLRGGFTSERFVFDFGSRKLLVTIRAEPGSNGRIEEFMAAPIS